MDYREADLEERLAISQAQNTSLEILQQLATDGGEDVRRAIALNPNADEALLRSLGKEFPEEVVQNPVFGLLLLENPESSFVLLSQARSVTASPELLERCAQSNEEELLIAVGGNPKTPLSVLEQLVNEPPVLSGFEYAERDDYSLIFTAIAENPVASPQLLEKIVEQWGVAEYAVARNPKTPIELLETFSNWRNNQMWRSLAQNPATPRSIIEKLVIEDDPTTCEMAGAHHNAPANKEELACFIERRPGSSPELLKALASDARKHVRLLVAQHPKTPASVLRKLAQDGDDTVAHNAVYNPSACGKALEAYIKRLLEVEASAISQQVKWNCQNTIEHLAEHPALTEAGIKILAEAGKVTGSNWWLPIVRDEKTSPSVLLILAKSVKDSSLLRDIVKNPSTPTEARLFLLRSPDRCFDSNRVCYAEDVLASLESTSIVPEAAFKNKKIQCKIAAHPGLTKEDAYKLLEIGDSSTLLQLAGNSATPQEILFLLATAAGLEFEGRPQYSPDRFLVKKVKEAGAAWKNLREELAGNRNIPQELQYSLAKDERAFFEIAKNPSAKPEILEELSKHPDEATLHWIAKNPSAPESLLANIVYGSVSFHRLGVAENPSVSSSLLKKLLYDSNLEVRQAAASNPNLQLEDMMTLFLNSGIAIRRILVSHSSINLELLSLTIKDSDPGVRAIAAGNALLNIQHLRQLSSDSSSSVRRQLIFRPEIDKEIIKSVFQATVKQLAVKDPDSSFDSDEFVILEKIAVHAKTPKNILTSLAKQDMEILQEAAGYGLLIESTKLAIENLNIPMSVLEELREMNQRHIRDDVILAILKRC